MFIFVSISLNQTEDDYAKYDFFMLSKNMIMQYLIYLVKYVNLDSIALKYAGKSQVSGQNFKKWSDFGGPQTNVEYIFNEICMIIGFCMIYISQNFQNFSLTTICIRLMSVLKERVFRGISREFGEFSWISYISD